MLPGSKSLGCVPRAGNGITHGPPGAIMLNAHGASLRKSPLQTRYLLSETARMIAAAAGKMETVKELLKRGASIDFLNKNNRSAIFYAVFMGHEDVALELLKAGATFEVPDQNGCTALIAASRDGMANLVKALVEKGANVNAVSTEGITPLMEAAGFSEPINKSLELVRLLLDSEADIDLEDFHGDTALTIAGQRGRTAVVQFLSDRGAKKKEIRINVSPYPVWETLPPEKKWILASYAITTQLNRNSHEILGGFPQKQRDRAKATLSKGWNVHDRDQTIDVLDRLQLKGTRFEYAEKQNISPERLLGWDYSRYLSVCSLAYVAGYFTEQEAWEIATPIAKKLQQSFHSWKEMGESYLLGRKIWSGKDESQVEAIFQLLLNPNDPNSPWNTVPWDTSLLPLPVPEKWQDDSAFTKPIILKLNQSNVRKHSP